GGAATPRGSLDELATPLTPGGVLAVAALVLPDGATEELSRQSAFSGVGTDLVLRNTPPVRVHRLRYTPADPATATRLAPAYRPSSVPLTESMHIDSNGVAAAGIALGLAGALRLFRPKSRLWLLPALAAAPVAAFFRDPERPTPVASLLARGERFGLIRFGSRTDVDLPAAAADPVVAPGEKVTGGATVIARWR